MPTSASLWSSGSYDDRTCPQRRYSINLPPPVMDVARLVAYAVNDDDVTYTGKLSLHVGGPSRWGTVGELPGLVIIKPYNDPEYYLLGFCDESWTVVGVIQFDSVEAAKKKAEHYYAGVTGKWQPTPYNEEQIREYLRGVYEVDPDSEWWVIRCSFCGTKDTDSAGAFSSETATICFECIESFRKEISKSE